MEDFHDLWGSDDSVSTRQICHELREYLKVTTIVLNPHLDAIRPASELNTRVAFPKHLRLKGTTGLINNRLTDLQAPESPIPPPSLPGCQGSSFS